MPLNRALSREHDIELSFPREEGCGEKWKMEDVLSDVRQMRQATKEAQSWLRTSKRLGPREGDSKETQQRRTAKGETQHHMAGDPGCCPISLGWWVPETALWTCRPEDHRGF